MIKVTFETRNSLDGFIGAAQGIILPYDVPVPEDVKIVIFRLNDCAPSTNDHYPWSTSFGDDTFDLLMDLRDETEDYQNIDIETI